MEDKQNEEKEKDKGKDKEKKPDEDTPNKLRPAGGPNRR